VNRRARLLQREIERRRTLDAEPDDANATLRNTNPSAVGRTDVLSRQCSCRGAAPTVEAHEHSDRREPVARPVWARHVHAPANRDEPPGLRIGRERLEQMRQGAFLRCSSRGGCERDRCNAGDKLHRPPLHRSLAWRSIPSHHAICGRRRLPAEFLSQTRQDALPSRAAAVAASVDGRTSAARRPANPARDRPTRLGSHPRQGRSFAPCRVHRRSTAAAGGRGSPPGRGVTHARMSTRPGRTTAVSATAKISVTGSAARISATPSCPPRSDLDRMAAACSSSGVVQSDGLLNVEVHRQCTSGFHIENIPAQLCFQSHTCSEWYAGSPKRLPAAVTLKRWPNYAGGPVCRAFHAALRTTYSTAASRSFPPSGAYTRASGVTTLSLPSAARASWPAAEHPLESGRPHRPPARGARASARRTDER
jgi:hypothetical protein